MGGEMSVRVCGQGLMYMCVHSGFYFMSFLKFNFHFVRSRHLTSKFTIVCIILGCVLLGINREQIRHENEIPYTKYCIASGIIVFNLIDRFLQR